MAVMLKLFSGKMGVVENLACRKEAQESFEPGADNGVGLQEKRAVCISLRPAARSPPWVLYSDSLPPGVPHGAPTAQGRGHFQLPLCPLGLSVTSSELSVLRAVSCTPDVKPHGFSLQTSSCEASLQAGAPWGPSGPGQPGQAGWDSGPCDSRGNGLGQKNRGIAHGELPRPPHPMSLPFPVRANRPCCRLTFLRLGPCG